MRETAKYLIVVFIAILVSAATSYVVTLSIQPTIQPHPSSSPSPQPTSTKILPTYNVTLDISRSFVSVYSSIVVHNLTISYHYTSLNGTEYTSEIGYGDYYPAWGVGQMIEAGKLPYLSYRIPQSIMDECSKVKITYDRYWSPLSYSWDIYPQLNVTEVYGYSYGS